jgi:hypothetical protein
MFSKLYQSENKNVCLLITIKCKGKCSFRAWAEDYGKVNSKYVDRDIVVDGQRTIRFSFPVTPKTLFIGVGNKENPQDKSFEVTLIEAPLRTYNIWLDFQTKRFLQLATQFSQVCGFENATPSGRLFQSENSEFVIKFMDIIKDSRSGTPLNTPSRIGHSTGIIEVAKIKFDTYTIPMRMMILLHEYSHKYKNPKIGLDISDEVGADINALYIYLGLGYSKIDAICVFANVFLKAQTSSNIQRMRKIMDYIQRFENQEYAELD